MANQFPIQRPYRVGAIEYVFFHTHLGTYAACLLTACVLNTMSGLIGVHWVVSMAVFTQIGNWSTAFFTLSIAIHTFNSLVLRIRQSPFVCASTIILGWVISIIAALIPFAVHSQIYGPVAITCTFRTGFEKANFLLHVLPILIGSLLSVLLYSIVFLVLRGTLNIRGGVKLTLDPHQRWSKGSGDMENYQRYVACLLPYSVVQLLVISNFKVPLPVVICAFVFWNLLGMLFIVMNLVIRSLLARYY
ncbi:hypothetical protein AMATHDRAFT_73644 [Amanita thiersii Skay4041]|uniref:G-protein coupled receptors family 1 profile domain-containing protein n=1 Tax=Amanita thiersii Skay4041 TaxID=703135 RepID=A0A2A9NXI3_9AGAR|nr:hypothetical protein AMATHDRAFT_73644 [Amanita thiersii Skay4041]